MRPENEKSAGPSHGHPDPRRESDDPRRDRVNEDPDSKSADEGGRNASPKPARQPGGGRTSESEKPDSPNSRWGGGR